MADSSGGIIAAHKLFGEKGRVAPQFALQGIMGTISLILLIWVCLSLDLLQWLEACSKYFDNGNLGIPGIVMLYGLSIYEIL